MSQKRWINAEPLKCMHCGTVLEIGAVRDGRSSLAEKFDSTFSPNWEYLIALECRECGAVYPLLRAKSLCDISATAIFSDMQDIQNTSV